MWGDIECQKYKKKLKCWLKKAGVDNCESVPL